MESMQRNSSIALVFIVFVLGIHLGSYVVKQGIQEATNETSYAAGYAMGRQDAINEAAICLSNDGFSVKIRDEKVRMRLVRQPRHKKVTEKQNVSLVSGTAKRR